MREFEVAKAIVEPARLRTRGQLALSCLWFGLNFQSGALLAIVVPAQIALLVAPGSVGNGTQAAFLSGLSVLGAVTALLLQPLVGAISDRSSGAWGRRRPFVALGVVLAIAGMAGLAIPVGLPAFVAGFLFVQVGSNMATGAYQAMLPDRVPGAQRGAASGYLGLMTILGSVGSLAVAGLLLGGVSGGPTLNGDVQHGAALFYLACGAVLGITLAVTLLGVLEDRNASTARTDGAGMRTVATWIAALRHSNFRWVFVARACVMLGIFLFMTFIEYYMAQVANTKAFVQATVWVAILALFSAVFGALVAGMVSDRIGRVPLVFVSSVVMAIAAGAFVADLADVPLPLLGVLFGLGYGAYYNVDWALAVDSLPTPEAAGKDMGVWSLASTLPQILAPFLGGLVIALSAARGHTALGYRLVFAGAAGALLLGAVFVLQVRERQARGEANDPCTA